MAQRKANLLRTMRQEVSQQEVPVKEPNKQSGVRLAEFMKLPVILRASVLHQSTIKKVDHMAQTTSKLIVPPIKYLILITLANAYRNQAMGQVGAPTVLTHLFSEPTINFFVPPIRSLTLNNLANVYQKRTIDPPKESVALLIKSLIQRLRNVFPNQSTKELEVSIIPEA